MSERDTWRQHLESTTRFDRETGRRAAEMVVPGLTILAHPDPARVGEVATLPGLLSGKKEPLSRLEPSFAPPRGGEPRPLADPYLSRGALRISRGEAGGLRLERGGSSTDLMVDGETMGKSRDLGREEIVRGVVLLLAERVTLLLHETAPRPPEMPGFGMVGEGVAIGRVRREIQRVADLPFPVLLRGESGTGKELAARAIHAAGVRCERPYLSVNLGAVPPTLAAAELFGAAKGAFTGAERERSGYFQRAEGGTLFLDEIAEAPPEVQVPLLRVLESGEIQPVGAARPRTVDVRVIAATDRDLEAAASAGGFRAPLLHRLASYEITLPPLRERREDFGRLFFHFLRRELEEIGEAGRLADPGSGGKPWVSPALVGRLAAHGWPGNVRELRNTVRQLAVASRGGEELRLTARVEKRLGHEVGTGGHRTTGTAQPPRKSYRDPDDVGEDELIEAMAASRWNLKQAAARLNVSRTTLYTLIDRSPRLRKASDLGREEIEVCSERCGGRLEAMAARLEVSKRGLKLRMRELGLRPG